MSDPMDPHWRTVPCPDCESPERVPCALGTCEGRIAYAETVPWQSSGDSDSDRLEATRTHEAVSSDSPDPRRQNGAESQFPRDDFPGPTAAQVRAIVAANARRVLGSEALAEVLAESGLSMTAHAWHPTEPSKPNREETR